MNLTRRIFSFIVVGIILYGCCEHTEYNKQTKIQFAVAGHVYGNPMTYTSTIYPNFIKAFRYDKEKEHFNLLFLTGDVVPHPTDSNWNQVIKELNATFINWHIAPGNHDFGGSQKYPFQRNFHQILDRKSYHFFRFRDNEFLILNTSHDGWTLDNNQLTDLAEYLSSINDSNTDNIFVFTHQLWWLNNAPIEFNLDTIIPNSDALQIGESNFWLDGFPIFQKFKIPVYFFGGDIGCVEKLDSYYEDHHKNFHFYGSGMGGGINDNYLIVTVSEQGLVNIEKRNF